MQISHSYLKKKTSFNLAALGYSPRSYFFKENIHYFELVKGTKWEVHSVLLNH